MDTRVLRRILVEFRKTEVAKDSVTRPVVQERSKLVETLLREPLRRYGTEYGHRT